jgi:hypothetical protein
MVFLLSFVLELTAIIYMHIYAYMGPIRNKYCRMTRSIKRKAKDLTSS